MESEPWIMWSFYNTNQCFKTFIMEKRDTWCHHMSTSSIPLFPFNKQVWSSSVINSQRIDQLICLNFCFQPMFEVIIYKSFRQLKMEHVRSIHYARFAHHCRPHHCRICELENEKMIGVGLKPAVKDHITAGFWLEPVVFWRPLITTGWSHKPVVIGLYHCRF